MRILILGALATLAGATAANAQTYTYNYKTESAETQGRFTVKLDNAVFSLVAFDGKINNLSYGLSDAGINQAGNSIYFGNPANGLSRVVRGTNDFYSFYFAPGIETVETSIFFTTPTSPDITELAATFSLVPEQAASAVPEPASWAMMIGGFGVIGGGLRTRRRAVRFATA